MSEWYVKLRGAHINPTFTWLEVDMETMEWLESGLKSRTAFTDRKIAHAWARITGGKVLRKIPRATADDGEKYRLEQQIAGADKERERIVAWMTKLGWNVIPAALERGDHWK